ncbi:MAG: O-antigen ligase family protein, partial [Pseudobdellovibrionaceae bacterium]
DWRLSSDWIWLPLLLAIALSLGVNAITLDEALPRWIELKWILTFYALLLLLNESDLPENFQKWAGGVALLCALYAIVVWFIGFDPFRGPGSLQTIPGGVRTGGFFGQAIIFAHSYAFAFCYAIGFLVMGWRWKSPLRFFYSALVLLLGLSLLLSFTRGVWISVSAAVLMMAFVYSRRLGFALVFVGLVCFSGLYFGWSDFQERLNYTSTGGDSERAWIWKANWQMFMDSPVFGVGYAENVKQLPKYYQVVGAPEGLLQSHAHNQYLHFLAGTGVVGLCAYLLVLLYFLNLTRKVWIVIPAKDEMHKALCLGALGAQMAFLVGGLTESNYEHSKIKYWLALTFAVVAWLGYKYQVIKPKVRP